MSDERLTVARVRHRVRTIARDYERSLDDEAAHSNRDALWGEVLAAIAAGASNPVGLAEAALKVNEVTFRAWCA